MQHVVVTYDGADVDADDAGAAVLTSTDEAMILESGSVD